MAEDEHGKRAGDDGSAPAELAKERDEKDRVGVPESVGEAERDERRDENA
jgi:hypothetical protein